MKKIFAIGLSVFVPLSLSFAQPKLKVVEGASFDLGEVFQGEKVERKLTIKNVGSEPLVIERIQPSCGCTATLLADKNVNPGKTTSLSITFDSKNFSGPVHKTVSIFSNDPDSATKEIVFTANVARALESTPPYFYFRPSTMDTTLSSYVVLKNVSDKPIEIRAVLCDEPGAKFDLRQKKLSQGESTQLSLTFTPSRTGYIYRDIVINTSHPKQPQFVIKLVCNVQGAKKTK